MRRKPQTVEIPRASFGPGAARDARALFRCRACGYALAFDHTADETCFCRGPVAPQTAYTQLDALHQGSPDGLRAENCNTTALAGPCSSVVSSCREGYGVVQHVRKRHIVVCGVQRLLLHNLNTFSRHAHLNCSQVRPSYLAIIIDCIHSATCQPLSSVVGCGCTCSCAGVTYGWGTLTSLHQRSTSSVAEILINKFLREAGCLTLAKARDHFRSAYGTILASDIYRVTHSCLM
jgi:hypothetical protein